jgi:hypothetical protein
MLTAMSTWSPTTEGFRTIFRRPSVSLAEIVWRWSFGTAACVLLGLAIFEYLHTLPVTNLDLLLLRTGHPWLISQAFSHILHGSALRVAITSIVVFSALAILWIFMAALGRGATLSSLLAYIRARALDFQNESRESSVTIADQNPVARWQIRSLLSLQFLRASLALAAGASFIAAVMLASFASSKSNPNPGTVFLIAVSLSFLIWLVWSFVSWFLSTASLFVVGTGDDTFAAVSATTHLLRRHFGPVLAVSTWFGLAHLVLFLIASSVVMFPLAFTEVVPPSVVLSAVLLLTLAYFALADVLYIGRLAAYAAIVEAPPVPPPAPSLEPSVHSIQPVLAMVDQDELILSDTTLNSPGTQESAASTQHSALGIPQVTGSTTAEDAVASEDRDHQDRSNEHE